MKCQNESDVKRYLRRFFCILDQMCNRMLNTNITNSITINFIESMIPHHQAAIYMCENLLNYTNYEELINIANNIIITQTRGIEQMREILMTTPGFINSRRDLNCYQEKFLAITRKMIHNMRNSRITNDINLNFTYEMIPHHKGAIAMCENLLNYNIDPRLKEVANSIIQEQSRGVEQLEQIKNNLLNEYNFKN